MPSTCPRASSRQLAPAGRLVVMDSPVYRRDAAGQAMVARRKADFRRRYGFESTRLGSREYLSDGDLADLVNHRGRRRVDERRQHRDLDHRPVALGNRDQSRDVGLVELVERYAIHMGHLGRIRG